MPGLCPRCNREVYFAEQKLALGRVWHTFCFSCRNCRKLLNSCSVITHLGELFCKNCYTRFSPSSSNYEIDATLNLSTTLAPSSQESLNYSCGVKNSVGNESLNRYHYLSGKCRLRGGGSEAEETNVCFDEEKKHFLENESANLGLINSMTTIWDPPASPTAVTTWYNRQHSKLRSTSFPESQKTNIVAKDCQFETHEQETNPDEKASFSNDEVNITETQLSTDKIGVASIDCNNKINKYDSARPFSANRATIPSRRKFAYPPVPPPRSPLPSRRRVSFHSVVFGDTRGDNQNRIPSMQDADHTLCCNFKNNKEYNSSYDIWQADDSVGNNDGGYENVKVNCTEDTGTMHFEKGASDCGEEDALKNCNDIEKSESDHRNEGNSDSHAYRIINIKEDVPSKEDTITCNHQSGSYSSNELDDNDRLRGGCGGPCGPRIKVPCGTIKTVETTCCCRREPDPCRAIVASCTTCSSPCVERRVCCPPIVYKKPIIKCRPSCTAEPQGCGGGGCCGSGCRGGCGKPGQTCLPRTCTIPPPSCRPCSPCSSSRQCPPPTICCCGRKSGNCCGVGTSGCSCRSKSPVCRVSRSRRCCSTDRADPIDSPCCRPKSVCECLGGGLDCQRCGRKVYQAEMQIVSGVPFHNICFSCYCCRKPLEPLTYQENCGEIYCKQCYVRNFGPQGYGYGVGPGTLQTPM